MFRKVLSFSACGQTSLGISVRVERFYARLRGWLSNLTRIQIGKRGKALQEREREKQYKGRQTGRNELVITHKMMRKPA